MLFFTYQNNLPPGVGYELFSPSHIVTMTVCIFLIFVIVTWYIKSDDARKLCIRKVTATIPVILMIIRLVYAVVCGVPIIYELPLHLCSMTGIFCFVFEFGLKDSSYARSLLGQSLYSLCLPGALMAIIFPDGTIYPIIHYISLESYLFHLLIIAYICIRIADKGIIPNVREAYKCILFLLVIVPPVYIYNLVFNTNFMYVIVPSSGSPLFGFYKTGGTAGYRIGFAFVVVAVIYLMNLVFVLINKLLQINNRSDLNAL